MFNLLTPTRRGLHLLAGLTAILGLSACDVDMSQVGTQKPSGGDGSAVEVALLVPYGSAASGDDALAKSLENAARLAVADLGTGKVKLKVYKTAGQAATAASAANRAVADGADVIIGPLRSDAANAAAVAVAKQDVNVLAFSNNAAIAGGNLFVLGNTFENIAERLMKYSATQGRNRLVIVHPNTPVGQIARNSIVKAASNSNAQIVAQSGFEFTQDGIANAAPEIANTVQSADANGVILTADSAGALPMLARLLPQNGVSPATVKYLGLARWDIPPQTLSLPGLQGGWFALPDPGLSNQFNARYSKAYGNQPHPLAGLAYDGIAAVGALAAKKRAMSKGNLTQSSGFKGVNGVFRLKPDGTTQRALAVAQVSGQQVKIVSPAPRAFGVGGF